MRSGPRKKKRKNRVQNHPGPARPQAGRRCGACPGGAEWGAASLSAPGPACPCPVNRSASGRARPAVARSWWLGGLGPTPGSARPVWPAPAPALPGALGPACSRFNAAPCPVSNGSPLPGPPCPRSAHQARPHPLRPRIAHRIRAIASRTRPATRRCCRGCRLCRGLGLGAGPRFRGDRRHVRHIRQGTYVPHNTHSPPKTPSSSSSLSSGPPMEA